MIDEPTAKEAMLIIAESYQQLADMAAKIAS
jgi:hypothetical protein